jgi:hypothetical protein
MSANKRKYARRTVKTVAYLYTSDGWPLGDCEMRDISEGGAKIVLKDIEEMPDVFLLSLSRNGRVRRNCRLMWRDGDTIGIQFSGRAPS